MCIYKDRLAYEYQQPAYITISLDKLADSVEVFKFTPPASFVSATKEEL
jgi:hypothetical protein